MYFLTFQTLLGSFVQRTSPNNLPRFIHRRSRCFASAKVRLFPFPPTIFSTFFIYFSFIFHLAEYHTVTNAKNWRFNGILTDYHSISDVLAPLDGIFSPKNITK
jgi:hypothetical protein